MDPRNNDVADSSWETYKHLFAPPESPDNDEAVVAERKKITETLKI